jgi:hypothetical protein
MELVENAAVKLTVSNNFAAEITARLERTEVIRDNKHSKDVLICWDHGEMITTGPDSVNRLTINVTRRISCPFGSERSALTKRVRAKPLPRYGLLTT